MPVIEQKTTNKNKVDFDLNRLDKSKTTIFSKYPFFPARTLTFIDGSNPNFVACFPSFLNNSIKWMVNSRSLAPWPSAPFPVFGTPPLCSRIAYSKRTAEYIIELERYSSLFSLSEQNTPFRFSSGSDTLHTAPHQSHR